MRWKLLYLAAAGFAPDLRPLSISEDADERAYWAHQIAGRYMGKELAEDYGKRNGVPGELLVRVQPGRVIARKGIAN